VIMIISEKDFQQFVKGDEKSFETIFCQYYKTLVSYVMRHDLVAMEAEDIVIETFHHIWQIREDLKSPAALHSLLFTATRNRTLNVARNLKNRQKIINENYSEQEETEEVYDYLIDEAVSQLPKQCELIIVGLLAGKTLQEIAGEMQISVNTAKTYKLRAIQSLRKLLKDIPFLVLLILIRSNRKTKKNFSILSPE
jgi:RNA polymerase sigma factor (sigma-70 family)